METTKIIANLTFDYWIFLQGLITGSIQSKTNKLRGSFSSLESMKEIDCLKDSSEVLVELIKKPL